MTEDERALAIAKDGLAGMVRSSHAPPIIDPELMISAALHVLAAFVAAAGPVPDDSLDDAIEHYVQLHKNLAWLPPPKPPN